MARERGVSVGNAYSGYGSFLPAKPPDVVKKMILVASKIHKDLFRKCLQGQIPRVLNSSPWAYFASI